MKENRFFLVELIFIKIVFLLLIFKIVMNYRIVLF